MNWKAFFVCQIKTIISLIIIWIVLLTLSYIIADRYFGLFTQVFCNRVEDVNDSTYMEIRTKKYVNSWGDTVRVKILDTIYREGIVLSDIPMVEIRENKEVIGDTTRITIDTIQSNVGDVLINVLCHWFMEIPRDSIQVMKNDSAYNSALQELIECSKENPNPFVDSAIRHLQGLD